ncbi:MAG: hypothetical protein GY874_11200 [Desulfobacteraceae bacterium]|nr:hypothetical protein [Desulfobacteraceae bacterium]
MALSTTDLIVDKLASYHAHWHKHDKEKCQFNYNYLRLRDLALISTIERKSVGILGLENAFELAGINPFCHLSGILYGKKNNKKKKKERFVKVLYQLMLAVGGPDNLNDCTVNSDRVFEPQVLFQKKRSYPICKKYNCELLPITFRSVYSQGRRLYGGWSTALKAAGFHYKRIRRKKSKYPRSEIMLDLLRFHVTRNGQFRIQDIRDEQFALYSAIFNSHETSPFKFADLPVMQTAFLELQYYIKKQLDPKLTIEKYCKSQNIT